MKTKILSLAIILLLVFCVGLNGNYYSFAQAHSVDDMLSKQQEVYDSQSYYPRTYGNVDDTSPSENSQSESSIMMINSSHNLGNVVTSNQSELSNFLSNSQYIVYEDINNPGYFDMLEPSMD